MTRLTNLSASIETIWAVCRAGFDWWIGELETMLPTFIRRISASARRTVRIDFLGEDIVVSEVCGDARRVLGRLTSSTSASAADRTALELNNIGLSRSVPVTIRLPRDVIWHKTIEVPVAAETNLNESMDLALEHHVPFHAAAVYGDSRIVRKDIKRGVIIAELAVVRREVVDHALETVTDWELSVDNITEIPRADEAHSAFSFLRSETRQSSGPFYLSPNLVLGFSAAALCVVLFLTVNIRWDRENATLATKVEQARMEAQEAVALRAEFRDLMATHTYLTERKRTNSVLPILADLASHLPDTAWLSDFQWDGREARITGLAHDATPLVEQLSKSKILHNVRFVSAITKEGEGNLQRFSIGFSLDAGPPEK